MKKKKQVTNVQYFESKMRRWVKAVTVYVNGKRCVKFTPLMK